MRKVPFFKIAFLLLSAEFYPIYAQSGDFEAPIEDAEISDEEFPTSNGQSKGDSNFKNRIFTISTFNYSPFRDKISIPPGLGFMEESSAVFELSGEINYNNLKNFAARADIQGSFSTLYGTYTLAYPKNYGNRIFLNEAFGEFYTPSGFSVLLGKYRSVFTPGVFENPADRINTKVANPGEPLERNGVWTIQLSQNVKIQSAFISSILLSAAFIPNLPENKYGFFQFYYEELETVTYPPVPYSVIEKMKTPWSYKDMGGVFRFYANLLRGDFNLMYYYFDKQNQGALSYARYLTDYIELHSEAAVYENIVQANENLVSQKNLYLDYLIGTRLDITDNIGFVFEYLHRDGHPSQRPSSVNRSQSYIVGILNSDEQGSFQTPLSDYLFGSFRFTEIDDRYNIYLNTIYGIKYQEWMISLRLSVQASDYLELSLFGSLPIGSSKSHYGGFLPYDYIIGTEVYGSF